MIWLILIGLAAATLFFVSQRKARLPALGSASGMPDIDLYNFEIVGEASYQTALKSIAGKKTEDSKKVFLGATVQHEPKNPYDSNAFKVSISNQTVGYFSSKDAIKFKEFLTSKKMDLHAIYQVDAVIVGGWKDDDGEGQYGVKLKLPSHLDF